MGKFRERASFTRSGFDGLRLGRFRLDGHFLPVFRLGIVQIFENFLLHLFQFEAAEEFPVACEDEAAGLLRNGQHERVCGLTHAYGRPVSQAKLRRQMIIFDQGSAVRASRERK